MLVITGESNWLIQPDPNKVCFLKILVASKHCVRVHCIIKLKKSKAEISLGIIFEFFPDQFAGAFA